MDPDGNAGRDPSSLSSALLDTGKGVLNSGVGLVEGVPNLLTGAIPGGPDYVPFLDGLRSEYDTPAFGMTIEVLTGVGVFKILGEMGAARSAVNKPVKPGDTGSYGDLKAQKKANGESEALHMDHQPSLAAQIQAKENALGRPLTKAERAQVKASTPAIASPAQVHQQTSPTYGGRNTKAQISGDAANLPAAAARDRAAFDNAMENR